MPALVRWVVAIEPDQIRSSTVCDCRRYHPDKPRESYCPVTKSGPRRVCLVSEATHPEHGAPAYKWFAENSLRNSLTFGSQGSDLPGFLVELRGLEPQL